jgi:hypothetical protein
MASQKAMEQANKIYFMCEDEVYKILEKFDEKQNIDITLTYVFFKAFYIRCVAVYLRNHGKAEQFEDIFEAYRAELLNFYRRNNENIPDELLQDIQDAFEKSFDIIESLGYKDLEDSYEFRHHIIETFELLRKILEKKSNQDIRVDIFENHISKIKEEAENVIDYAAKNL